jgi:hypothetical protein
MTTTTHLCGWCKQREGVNRAFHLDKDGNIIWHDTWYCQKCTDSFEPAEEGDDE